MQAKTDGNRLLISSGVPWEESVGYSRAVKVANMVFVSGTTATNPETGQVEHAHDVEAQARYVFSQIEKALAAAGATLKDVVRTRMYVTDISHWQDIARVHAEIFSQIKPAATMVQVQAFISPQILIEVETDAVIAS